MTFRFRLLAYVICASFNNLLNRPHMLTDPRFHRRSNPESLVNPREVVVHVEQRYRVHVVLNLLLNALVKRVKRRMDILMVKFWRSM